MMDPFTFSKKMLETKYGDLTFIEWLSIVVSTLFLIIFLVVHVITGFINFKAYYEFWKLPTSIQSGYIEIKKSTLATHKHFASLKNDEKHSVCNYVRNINDKSHSVWVWSSDKSGIICGCRPTSVDGSLQYDPTFNVKYKLYKNGTYYYCSSDKKTYFTSSIPATLMNGGK